MEYGIRFRVLNWYLPHDLLAENRTYGRVAGLINVSTQINYRGEIS